MDSSSRRLHSQVPEAGEGPSLLDLFKLIQSVEKRLTDRLALIANDLKQRLCVAETSLESAHEKMLSLETDLTKLRDEIASFKEEKRKSDILNELRSKEFNVLFHGLKMSSNTENSDESESVVRSFLVKDLKFPQAEVDRMYFANVHRLPRRVDATHSSTNSTHTSPPIVVKLCKMKDKFIILKLAPRARQFKCNITKHLPLSMQRQRKLLMKQASSLYAAGKRIQWKINDSDYCLYANSELVLPN